MRRRISIAFFCISLAFAGVLGANPIAIAQAPSEGGLTSEGIEFLGFVPFEQSSSTGLTIHGDRMYLTSWKNISIYDISDPKSPQQLGTLPIGFMFENENVSVSPNDSFLLFSESLPDDTLHVYDIEDPANITEIAALDGAGDHTTSCILKCQYAYGSDGHVTDLRDPGNPKLMDIDWHEAIGMQGGGHDVTEVRNGFIIVSPLDDTPLYVDVRDPMKPKVLARGNGPIVRDERGYLWHSGEWPNHGTDRWLLMQGEENAQTRCSEKIGPFTTFDTRGWRTSKTFKMVDDYKVTNGVYVDGNPPANALGCSAHWFEEHPSFDDGGLVAGAFYEHGTRFTQVNHSTGKIKEVGYFLPYVGSSSAAYWASPRITYTADYGNGLYILRWARPLPGPLAALRVSNPTPARGREITLTGLLRSCRGLKGTELQLKRKVGKEFKLIRTKTLDDRCRTKFKVGTDFDEATFKAVWPKQDKEHGRGNSDPQTIKTH